MTCSILEPSLDDDFAFRKEANRLLALSVQDSEEGVFHPAKWEESNGRYDPNIDTNITAHHVILKIPGTSSILCKDRMTIPEGVIITYLNSFIQSLGSKHTHHWTKDLLTPYSHLWGYIFKNRRTHKAGIRKATLNLGLPSIESQFGPFFDVQFRCSP